MSGAKARILVVDDHVLNRKLVCDLLALEGYEVQQSEDALQALALLSHGPLPDLVLMDLSLPGMDGLTFTRQLKADPQFSPIPIVALTALAMKGDEEKALAAGCSGYIMKPIDTRRLPTQITEALAAGVHEPERLRIMVVEDHRIDLKLVADAARLSGHVVLSSTTAEQALASLTDEDPDVVLLDLNLPGMDGLSFVRLLKSNPETSGLPIVAVTAYDDAFRRGELLAAGCAAYLVKPVDMTRLMRELHAASGKRR